MGVIFLEHMGGPSLFVCKTCRAPITNLKSLLKTMFFHEGMYYVFKVAVNLVFGPTTAPERGILPTDSWTRSAFCKKCNTKLGWRYELIPSQTDHIKEGHIAIPSTLLEAKTEKVKDEDDEEYSDDYLYF